MTIRGALAYFDYCAKEGNFDLDELDGLTPDEVIKLAKDMSDKGDAIADSARKGEDKL